MINVSIIIPLIYLKLKHILTLFKFMIKKSIFEVKKLLNLSRSC
jgi:hypothetical protein